MSLPARIAASVLGITLSVTAWLGCSEATAGPAEIAGISILSDPAPALVFLDGVFIGETHSAQPLEVTARPGSIQVRISEAGHIDTVFNTLLVAGSMRSFKATLARAGVSPSVATPLTATPIRLSVGQTVRGILCADAAGTVAPVRYVIDEATAPHRLLTLLNGVIGCKITDADGKEIALQKLEKPLPGTPGRGFFEYRGNGAGRYCIEIAGKAGPFSFRFGQGLPPLSNTNKPGLKGRREAPRAPGG